LLRSSPEFILLWKSFLQDSLSQVNASPVFYQHVTDKNFHKLVKQEFQIKEKSVTEYSCLDNLERNAQDM